MNAECARGTMATRRRWTERSLTSKPALDLRQGTRRFQGPL
jgi:hypothetical protein